MKRRGFLKLVAAAAFAGATKAFPATEFGVIKYSGFHTIEYYGVITFGNVDEGEDVYWASEDTFVEGTGCIVRKVS